MKSRSLHALAALVAGVFPHAAMGQSADEPQSGGLAEVIVTAERREASLQTVPVPVSALSEAVLENRQITESRDLARFVPSLRMANNITSPTNLSPSLRGSLQQDASLVVAESPFGVYVDDVYVARLNGNNVTLSDIERIEVLRGPQGTLYGRNSLSGAIKYISRTPGEDSWGDIQVGAGNWDQYRVSASVGGPVSERWAASIAGQINSKDEQFENVVTGEKTGKEENWAGRGKLRYTGSETFDALVSLSYAKSENDSLQLVPRITPGIPGDCSPTPPTPAPPPGTVCQFTSDDLARLPGFPVFGVGTSPGLGSPPPISSNPRSETEQTIASLALTWDFGSASLKAVTGYVKVEDYFSTDFFGASSPMFGIVAASEIDNDHWSQEIQLQGTLGDRLNYIVGAYYFDEEGEQDFGWRFITPTSTSQIEASTESIALFAQGDYKITDALKATAGVRWSEDSKDFDIRFQRLPSSVVPGPATDRVTLENTYSEVTPRLGLDYTIAPGDVIDSMLLYVSAAEGFKSGGYNGINIFNLNVARAPYSPETNRTYEVGIKTDLLDRRLRINANYFHATIEDLALNATVEIAPGLFDFPVQNAGEATIQGLEFEVTAVPLEGLTLFLTGALLDGEYDELNPLSAPAMAPSDFGVEPEPPQVPDYSFTAGFDWNVPLILGGRDAVFKLGGDYFRTDDFITAATNDFRASAYDRISAYTALELGDHLEFRFDMRNLTDEETIATGSRALGGFVLLPPREWMASIRYRF
jgi:iron complex outermembrane receptor protein